MLRCLELPLGAFTFNGAIGINMDRISGFSVMTSTLPAMTTPIFAIPLNPNIPFSGSTIRQESLGMEL